MERGSNTGEFKAEAVKQVIERGHSLVELSNRLGVATVIKLSRLLTTNCWPELPQETSFKSCFCQGKTCRQPNCDFKFGYVGATCLLFFGGKQAR